MNDVQLRDLGLTGIECPVDETETITDKFIYFLSLFSIERSRVRAYWERRSA